MRKTKIIVTLVLITAALLSACTSTQESTTYDSEDELELSEEARIDILYEHTVLMIEYTSQEDLDMLNFYPEFVDNSRFPTRAQKIDQMVKSFNTTNPDITHLENTMVEMMRVWDE